MTKKYNNLLAQKKKTKNKKINSHLNLEGGKIVTKGDRANNF